MRTYNEIFVGKSGYWLLICLAVLTWVLVKVTDIDEQHMTIPAHSADLFSKDYVKWEMGTAGTLKSKLTADRMLHYQDDGTTHLDEPQIIFENDKLPPWIVKSESAILSSDGKNLSLNGQVVINRAKAKSLKPLTITTRNLKITPETSYAETSERVELFSPPNVTTGTGMKLIFVQPIHLQLLADVKGRYEKK